MSCQLPPHSFLYGTRYMHHLSKEVLPWHLENVFLVYVSIYLKGLQFMKLNFLNNKNKVIFFMLTLYSNCDASHCNKEVTGRMIYFHYWHCLELLFPLTCRSTVPQRWQVFPKSGWGARALRADSQQDNCMGTAPENSKERTLSFSYSLWPNLNGSCHTSVQGREQQGPKKLERVIFE